MRTITLFVIVLVVAAGAYYWFSTKENPLTDAVRDTNTRQENVPASVRAQLVGSWRSTEDTKFTREFSADGTVTDRYEGDEMATQVGTWETFTSANPDPGLRAPATPGTTYLKIEGQYEVLFYSIVSVTQTSLELTYLDRGNTLRFTKVR